WLLAKGDVFRRWLLFWIGATFLGLTLAGEKMPWLEVHLALPLAIAGGVCLAKALDDLEIGARWPVTLAQGAVGFIATLLLFGVGGSAGLFGGLVLLAGTAGWVVLGSGSPKAQEMLRGGLAISVAVLLALTMRAGVTAAFDHGDVPVEMLVYTQTS